MIKVLRFIWQQGTEPQDAKMTDPGTQMTPKRMTQTAMGSFVVPQTVEERKNALKSRSKILLDMSASPILKPRKKTQPCRRMWLEDVLKVKKMPG